MRWHDFDVLAEVGFTTYERKALAVLMVEGVADAETLCREGGVPSSKIYQAMEKLGRMGLVEIQPTRPKLYAALPGEDVVNRLIDISRHKAEEFASRTQKLKAVLSTLPERAQGRRPFADLALGVESHVKRHVTHLATAQRRILSHLEHGDLAAINQVTDSGFPVLRRIARNTSERNIDQRVVFGFGYQTAPLLLGFLRKHRTDLEQVTGFRYSGELGHPFHVVDDDMVILCQDHPFISEGRFASILVRDRGLADKLAEGFEKLWNKAMRNLKEISFHPPGSIGQP